MPDPLDHVRALAHQVAEVAHSDRMVALRRLWARHNNLEKVERPPVLCRPACWHELIPADSLVSPEPVRREIEYTLRQHLYKAGLADDSVIEPWVEVAAVHLGADRPMMWGVNIDVVAPEHGGAFAFKPEIKEEGDLSKLKVPDWRLDEAATRQRFERASELLDGILEVRLTYGRLHGAGLAYWAAYLRGLNQMMLDCSDRPQWLHRFMKLLSDAHVQHLRGLEADGHLTRNDNGLLGHCDGLPQPDFDGEHVRLIDTWCGADAQEFALVSPAMHEEFLLQYQAPIANLHGLTSYGCCESLNGKIGMLKRHLPNLRRLAVSPWTDLEYAAAECLRDYVMQWRPKPTDVVFTFDEADMVRDVTRAMAVAGNCLVDICLQDIETVAGRPETLLIWTRLAQEVGARMYHR